MVALIAWTLTFSISIFRYVLFHRWRTKLTLNRLVERVGREEIGQD
jgi:hypothetical protein